MSDHKSQAKNVEVAAIVLAAGKGTRMKSEKSKVLHHVAGRPMISWVLESLNEAQIRNILVVINEEQKKDADLKAAIGHALICVQKKVRGTGDAVASSAGAFEGVQVPHYAVGEFLGHNTLKSEYVIICAGDTPCLQGSALKKFISDGLGSDLCVLGTRLEQPFGYGRLVTNGERLLAIVEEKDCSQEQKKIDLVNTGIYLVKTRLLFALLDRVVPNNAQKEYYLTDIVKIAQKGIVQTLDVRWSCEGNSKEYSGVNDRHQLSVAEQFLLTEIKRKFMLDGVKISLPDSVYLDWSIKLEPDSEIGSGCVLLSHTEVGRGSILGQNTVLKDTKIGQKCRIGPLSYLEGVVVGDGESIPPGTVRMVKKGV